MSDSDLSKLTLAADDTHFEATFQHAHVGIAHVGLDGRWLRVNDTVCAMLGYSRGELVKLTFQDITHPDDLGEDVEQLKLLARGEIDVCRMEKRYFKKDHSIIWVDLQVATLRSDNGEILYCVSTLLDITQRKETEQRNLEVQRRLQYALDAGRLGEWSLDLITGDAERTLRHDQIFGYDRLLPEWTYDMLLEHIYVDDRPAVEAAFQQALNHGVDWNFETRILRADGVLRWIWERGSVTEFEGDFPLRLSGVVQDITQRKRFEQGNHFLAEIAGPLSNLVDYESTLRTVACLAVPHLADWCVIDFADQTGKLRRVASSHTAPEKVTLVHRMGFAYTKPGNSVLQQILNQRTAQKINELTDADLQSLSADADQLEALRQLNPRAFVGVPMVVRNECIGVMAFFTSESGRRYTYADVGLAERIAERVSTALENARLYQTVREADQRKDIFLALLAHELRNPLGAISNGAALLRASCTDEHSQRTLEMIKRQTQHLTFLLDDLMDVSRINRGKVKIKKRNIALTPLLDDVIASLHARIESKQQHLQTRFEAGNVLLHADPDRLEQIVTNLLSNAIKYTPCNGTITLSTQLDDSELVIQVADTGIGIAADHLEHVFELFTQYGAPESPISAGLGLGLTLVRDLVELHDGSVAACSEGKNKGSTFTVRLPVSHINPVEVSVGGHPDRMDQSIPKGLNILLVDDHEDAIVALAQLLQLQGHAVRTAQTGRAALEAVKEQRPELILLDLGLPDISGYEVARQLRVDASNECIHVVALTGYGQARDREQTKASGFDDHLVKPLNLAILKNVVQRLDSAHVNVEQPGPEHPPDSPQR